MRTWEIVPQQSELGRVAVVQQNVQVSVAIEIERDEGAAVLGESQAGNSGQIRESTVALIPIKNVALVTAEAAIEADQAVQQGPAALVLG